MDSPTNKHNMALANLGLQSYLKMLLNDNFIRALSDQLCLSKQISDGNHHAELGPRLVQMPTCIRATSWSG